jgi:filamentous hemagglutinin family protein
MFYLLSISFSSDADITLDGTLGQSSVLTGPQFNISAELGQQVGGNLFHSFRQFDIWPGEIATFSGPESVNTIISRVTGGTPSHINGELRSTIPHADFYFLNPAGIWFGNNAKLDVQGSFHVSTADTLHLATEGQFNARYPEQSSLAVAPPSAFGFLTATPAAITLENSQLAVPANQALSLIGGDLSIKGDELPHYERQPDSPVTVMTDANSKLTAQSGRINLASIASRGEVMSPEAGLFLNTPARGGQMTITNTHLNVSGEAGGSVFIRSGRFELSQSTVTAETRGTQAGGKIDVQADNMKLNQGAQIATRTYSSGEGGTIILNAAEALILSGVNQAGIGSSVVSNTIGQNPEAGFAGRLEITTKQLILQDGAQITSSTFGAGKGGIVSVQVDDTLTLEGINENQIRSGIFSESHSKEKEAGAAGRIEVKAHQIKVTNGARISTINSGPNAGGVILLKVTGTLEVSKAGLIISSSRTQLGNQAGSIEIVAQQLNLVDQAGISNSTFGSADGGTIMIKVVDKLTMNQSAIIKVPQNKTEMKEGRSGNLTIEANHLDMTKSVITNDTLDSRSGGKILILVNQLTANSSTVSSSTHRPGKAGDIEIKANYIKLSDQVEISNSTFDSGEAGIITIKADDALILSDSGIFSNSASTQPNAGQAGNIAIEVRNLKLMNEAVISSSTVGPGQGGNINVKVADVLVAANGGIGSVSESPENNAGQAGNIKVQANQIKLTTGGEINTSSQQASGGNITINTPHLLYLQNGEITTSVQGGSGSGGNILIENPVLLVLNQARIIADAHGGEGGNITIRSEQYLRSAQENVVSASSKLSTPGTIVIIASEKNIGQVLEVLPSTFFDHSNQLKNRCAVEPRNPNQSKFRQVGREGTLDTPDRLHSGSVLNESKYHNQLPIKRKPDQQ